MTTPAEVDADPALIVVEVFGPTLQGEGPSAGQPASFIRLSRCNLSCSFCDTPYTWDWKRFDPRTESSRCSATELAERVLSDAAGLVVITGGEPLLQQPQLVPLVRRLLGAGREVEIETNGTRVPMHELVAAGVRFNVSPKLANADLAEQQRLAPEALKVWVRVADSGQALFKFVACGQEDLEEIDALVQRYGLAPVWVMPEGTTPEEVMARGRVLADSVIARNWGLTLRTHTLLWGDERGR